MILGFLGKGGSGKSSVATQIALYLHSEKEMKVLAIDADHNMDLSYNLFNGEIPSDVKYFGSSLKEITRYLGLSDDEKYDRVFQAEIPKRFSLSLMDDITKGFCFNRDDGMKVMIAGPQTDTVLYGQSCSHSLTTPLKIYLPLLELGENEYVVVDEKAGADGVSTGIVTGIDVGIIVCEPALHSIKTAKQIAKLMDFYQTPYVFVGNKIQSQEDIDFIIDTLGEEPIACLPDFPGVKRNPGSIIPQWSSEVMKVLAKAQEVNNNNRLNRTMEKFRRNREFENK